MKRGIRLGAVDFGHTQLQRHLLDYHEAIPARNPGDCSAGVGLRPSKRVLKRRESSSALDRPSSVLQHLGALSRRWKDIVVEVDMRRGLVRLTLLPLLFPVPVVDFVDHRLDAAVHAKMEGPPSSNAASTSVSSAYASTRWKRTFRPMRPQLLG